jgi:hypothetical protein
VKRGAGFWRQLVEGFGFVILVFVQLVAVAAALVFAAKIKHY